MEAGKINHAANVVHVTVPSSVANNFDKMTSVTKSILGLLGCGTCHSGKTILFQAEGDGFVVDEDLNVTTREAGK